MERYNMHWTKAEDEKLVREYKKKDRKALAIEMGRTPASLAYRYHCLLNDNIGRRKEKFKKSKKCPICGGTNINIVITFDKGCKKANYCLDCLHEFKNNGEIIPPLLEGEVL